MKYAGRTSSAKSFKKPLIILGIIIAIVIAATVAVRHIYFQQLEAIKPGSSTVQLVEVEMGSSADQIAAQLEKAGLIRSAWAFKLYVSSQNVRDALQAGTYSLSTGQDVSQIVSVLTHGKLATDLATILPGQNLEQIRSSLISYGFKASDVTAALNPALYAASPALVDKPAGASLEGYIYPDSYQKDSNTTPQDIIREALNQMDHRLTPDLRAAFAKQGLSTYQGIILASVVEREVSKSTDRAQAAQVFLKRMRTGMHLESDATKPAFDSYTNAGLPPEPISNVSESSLRAVAYPTSTDWLYFVSGDDGTTHFNTTLEEHEADVAQYCHKLCSQ
jgi:UPF0755 protein